MMRDTFDTLSNKRDRGLFGDNDAPERQRITGKSDLKDFTLCVHRDDPSDKAILLSKTGEEAAAHWFPRELLKNFRDTGTQTKGKTRKGQSVMLAVVEVTMPEWLAKQNGLV